MMVVFFVIAVAAAVVTASAELSAWASLDVARVAAGEFWRLFSGHLAHLSWRQYAVDAPVFLLLYGAYGRRAGGSNAVVLCLVAALSVSLTVTAAGMHQIYGGLSGLSCAALSALILTLIREDSRNVLPYLMGLACAVYLVFLDGSAGGVPVAHEAHAAGVVSGLAFATFCHALLPSVCRER